MKKFFTKYTLLSSLVFFMAGIYVMNYLNQEYDQGQALAFQIQAIEAYDARDYVRSAALLNMSIAKNPEKYSTHLLLAEIYERNGEVKHAINSYKKALSLSDGSKEFHFDMEKINESIDRLTSETKGSSL